MKYSDYFHARGIRITSVFYGALVGLTIGMFTNWQYGLLGGAVVSLLASFVLPLRLYLEEKPYVRIKKTMNPPFLLDQRVRFTVRGGTVGGYFILTQTSMILLSLERGDHRLELKPTDVKSIRMGEDMTISIFLNEKQFIRVISGDCKEIYGVLRENGWMTD